MGLSLEYNTGREHLTLREYGRNVQNLVKFIRAEEDKTKRNKYATLLVELMKAVNPEFSKDAAEYTQKVWDDLFIISKFNLDVESPFPIPESTILDRKPDIVAYQSNRIKFRHYGRNLEILIENAMKLEDPLEREGAVIAIGKLMKSFYQTWNKDTIEDETVLKNIKLLSKNELDIDMAKVKEFGLFDSEKKERTYDNNRSNRNRPISATTPANKGGKRNFKQRRRPNI
ncbi:MAG: hypothetical protein ACJA08_000120 [Cyclobacteriaceae bacterium]|jgi:hypothetical protein